MEIRDQALGYLRRLREHTPPLREEVSPAATAPHRFVLIRILGNDLYPRHRKGQTLDNLRFILDHEPDLPHCEKHWVINCIIDREQRNAIVELLTENDQPFIELPFREAEFASEELDLSLLPEPGFLSSSRYFRLKPTSRERVWGAVMRRRNQGVTAVNAARNVALEYGRKLARWVLPWDGNCFVTGAGWQAILDDVHLRPQCKYFVVPMQRMLDNRLLFRADFEPEPLEEPQLIFRQDASERFDENYWYGRRDKIELFWRLGIPGPWDEWKDEPWDLPRGPLSQEAGLFAAAGWVARLYSGTRTAEVPGEEALVQRGLFRQRAINDAINHVVRESRGHKDEWGLSLYSSQAIRNASEGHVRHLLELASQAMLRKPGSVTEKIEAAPGGSKHDYFHPAPYWWPDPRKLEGLPYIRRDGERIPGTRLHEPGSERYDRSRLQRLFDDGTILALAWAVTGEKSYAERGAQALRTWFIESVTRMTPHLRFAQVRRGHDEDEGSPRGIIEAKDFYYYLDAVRLFEKAGAVNEADKQVFRGWLATYLDWLLTSRQGISECKAANNHGICYDLQVAAISSYLEDHDTLFKTFIRACDRIRVQFSPNGIPLHELSRTNTAHYCAFNLQSWLNLAELARRYGEQVIDDRLERNVQWLLDHAGQPWPYPQKDEFDARRLAPIALLAKKLDVPVKVEGRFAASFLELAESTPCFHPDAGVPPFWVFALTA